MIKNRLHLKRIVSLVLALVLLVVNINVCIYADEYNGDEFSYESYSSTNIDSTLSEFRSSGLAWGPVQIGNLWIKITNPHTGPVGDLGNVTHVNLHVYKKNNSREKDILNLHIVKYEANGSECIYIWDSVSKQVFMDSCFDDFTNAAEEIIDVVKETVSVSLKHADWVAKLAIWGTIVVVVSDLIMSLTAIPAIVPFSVEPNENSIPDFGF